MTGNPLPPEPPPVFLPEPKRDPEPYARPHTPPRRAAPEDLKFDFPADAPPEDPAPRGNKASRLVFWLILGVIGILVVQSGTPVRLLIYVFAAVVFAKRWRSRR